MNEKNCTPDNCPHAALLERARAACLACTCGGRPAGHGGQVSIEAAGERIVERQAVEIDRTPRGQVTNLPPAVEQSVADLLRGWLDLSAVEVLLVHHICNGGTTQTFGAKLVQLREVINRMKPQRSGMRATAWAQWRSIMCRFPFMAKLQSWKPGHGGAVSPLVGRMQAAADNEREWERQKRTELLASIPDDLRGCGRDRIREWVDMQLAYSRQQRQMEKRQATDDERVQWLIERERMGREIGQAASGVPSAGTEAGPCA